MKKQVTELRPSTLVQTDDFPVDDRPAITRRSQFFAKVRERVERISVATDALKGHEGHEVTLTGHVDAARNEVHVVSVKMGKAQMKDTTKKDEMKK